MNTDTRCKHHFKEFIVQFVVPENVHSYPMRDFLILAPPPPPVEIGVLAPSKILALGPPPHQNL